MRRTVASLAVLLSALPALAACGGSDSSDSPDPADAGPKVIEVTIEGDSVTPNGERVEVAVGQDVELEVTADVPGEIHVHSSPEQALEYDAGTQTVTIEGIDKPGTVDVESHDPAKVIVQLEVR
ncbi:MAG TPA: hypothetical protein VD864_16295 [Nocardioides sp.]|nr:hypothetical protein [Nocardioides sp.]